MDQSSYNLGWLPFLHQIIFFEGIIFESKRRLELEKKTLQNIIARIKYII